MNRILLSATLCAILVSGFRLPQPVRATAAPAIISTSTQRKGGGGVYKLERAGIQFLVPEGWKVEKDKDGDMTVSKQEGESIVVFTIGLLPPDASALTPEDQFKAASEGTFSNMKELKLDEPGKRTVNGIPATGQSFKAKDDGVDMAGLLILLSADKPVLIFMYGTAQLSEGSNKEVIALLDSIRKVE
jgi:hypothetical protein